MKKGLGFIKFIIYIIIVSALFVALCTNTAKKTFSELKAGESFDEVDYYSMQEFSDQNVQLVFSSLKSGKIDDIKGKMNNSEGLDDVAAFANWSEADFDEAVGIGAGSLSPKPDADGRMDMSERFFVNAGDAKYVFFIESVSSRWGRTDDGISSIGVTTYEHFDGALEWGWCGEKDDSSALAGELFWENSK